MPNLNTALSAFGAYGTIVSATAHNIANINTNEFKSYDIDLADRANFAGVQVNHISRDYSTGPAIINHIASFNGAIAANHQSFEVTDQSIGQEVLARQYSAKNDYGETVASWDKAPSREWIDPVFTTHGEGSNVDLPLQFSNLMIAEHAYGANAAVVRTVDEMTGSLVNMKI